MVCNEAASHIEDELHTGAQFLAPVHDCTASIAVKRGEGAGEITVR
jgi:hypothetical protein